MKTNKGGLERPGQTVCVKSHCCAMKSGLVPFNTVKNSKFIITAHAQGPWEDRWTRPSYWIFKAETESLNQQHQVEVFSLEQSTIWNYDLLWPPCCYCEAELTCCHQRMTKTARHWIPALTFNSCVTFPWWNVCLCKWPTHTLLVWVWVCECDSSIILLLWMEHTCECASCDV